MKLKYCAILTLLLLLYATDTYSQAYKIVGCKPEVNDLAARTSQRLDGNGTPCALVKVRALDEVASAQGNVVGNVQKKDAESWVYLTDGSQQVNLTFKNHLPLELHFADWGFKSVKSNAVYVVTVTEVTKVEVETGSQYLVMSVSPKNAVAYIDGQMVTLSDDGSLYQYLPYGEHTYKVDAVGYRGQSGSVTVSGDKKTVLQIALQSIMATLKVSCTTPQSSIYINNELKGVSPWSGALAAGIYNVEARKEGYHTESQSVALAENEQRDVKIPSLQEIVGSMNVAYTPADAEVYIDGTKIGTSPDIFRDIMVGSHSVEIRKGGYESARLNVEVKEKAVSDVTGSLKQSVTVSNNTPTNNPLGSSSTSSSSSTSNILSFKVKGVKFNMIKVDGGTFTMGATSEQENDANYGEEPAHSVTMSSYYIGETEVTQALWKAVMGSTPSYFKGHNKPVEQVSWDDCQIFISRLNSVTGQTFSLPTEAQWEYAARGGRKSQGNKYSGSGEIGSVACYNCNSSDKPNDVATKSPNELGIYDMSGNVWEWCSDWYGGYSSDSQTNPTGASSGSDRVNRGGSWNGDARCCRVSVRGNDTPDCRDSLIGLRLALVVL